MAYLFTMPQLGSTMEEGLIVRWHKQEGEAVRKGDILLEIETDKATMDVEADRDGIVHKILAEANVSVSVRKPIAIIGAADEEVAHLLAELANGEESSLSFKKLLPDREEPSEAVLSAGSARNSPVSASFSEVAPVFISPRARRYAEMHGIPVATLAGRGTGPEGRVIERDVVAYLDDVKNREASAPSAVSTLSMLASTAEALQTEVREAEAQKADSQETEATATEENREGRNLRATPLARTIAGEMGIDLSDLATGLPGSRVRSEDVLRHVESNRSKVEISAGTQAQMYESSPFVVRPFVGMRKRIADNVTKSAFTAPHVTLTLEVDMTECVEFRERLLPEVEKVYGARLSYTDILVKAVARALEAHPRLNSALVENEIREYRAKHIGVALALEKGLLEARLEKEGAAKERSQQERHQQERSLEEGLREEGLREEGLIVPVVKNAESKSLGVIASELKQLTVRARSGKFTPDDLAGGTFTITNLGAFGIDRFDPILVTGQAAILGVGRIADKPVVIEKAVTIRAMMNLCLSFDHRILDGAPAARFLQRLKELLENPMLILI